ncbi:MAG: hypothetical protein A2V93_12490 [Ignavibacteria bacterium RBG_16_34_14]|nr:MAG: hypothetical protein A2V93_12490 [Ignavibacteria bacterium RBG_16_34_14]
MQDNYFDALLDSFQLDILKKSGYLYEIIIDDVTKDYLERTKESREKIKLKKPCQPLGFGYGSMGGFYTFSEVVAQLDTMRLLYPNLITVKDSIGASIEVRAIWSVKISDNPDLNESEAEVFYNALIHAREPMGMMTVIYFMYYLLENYGINPEITYLVDNRELYFMPVINPDGYAYNEQISPNGGGMWRKNRRDNGGGVFGVNLNCNFGYMWGYDDIGSSPYPSNSEYRGTGPFSEPESQSFREYCIDNNFIVSCSYHTHWNVIFPPWGYNLEQTPDSTIFNNLITLAIALNGYRNGIYIPPPENYPVNGYSDDWMYGETSEKNKIFGILPEVGNHIDGSWPIPERIFPLAEENLYSNIVYAWGPGIIENPPYIKNESLNLSYCRPLIDTLRISAIENNPDNHTSNVYAQLLNPNDSLLNEFQLNQTDSTFDGELFFATSDENFYKIRFKQTGLDIPSNFYSSNNKLKFTTAGPLKMDSVAYVKISNVQYGVKPYVKNYGTSMTISGAKIRLYCDDPWIFSIGSGYSNLPDIIPGATVAANNWILVQVIDSLFNDQFNFIAEITSNGWPYWKDTLQLIIPPVGVEEELYEIPTEFLLSQNYPNPFNPNTKIKYSIPQSSNVVIKVFDILGSEIETLVNVEKPAGTYELNWNAANLPSGVYFYQLKAGSFVETNKMILLK